MDQINEGSNKTPILSKIGHKLASFFKITWKIITFKKVVFIAITILLVILLFAGFGPLVVRGPYDQVRLVEPVPHDQQFTSVKNFVQGEMGTTYNISGKIPADVADTNSSDHLFYISGEMRVWQVGDLGELYPLFGNYEFFLWRGNLSTYQTLNELIGNKTVDLKASSTTNDFVVNFGLNASDENIQSPYVLSFTYLPNPELESDEIYYTLETYVTWITVQDNLQVLSHPTWNVLLGTDEFGHDTFAQLAHATRNSLKVGLMAGLLATFAAVIVGAVSGYIGKNVDEFTQLVVNIIMVFPVFPLLLILAAFVDNRSLSLVSIIIAVTSWPWAARAVRAQILSLKERDFVRLAKISGKSGVSIAIKELLPNMASYILLIFAIQVGSAIGAEAGISLLGFGPDPRTSITLGSMLFWVISAESIRSGFWWLYFPPGLILTIIFVILYILQSNIDEIFNPRLRSE